MMVPILILAACLRLFGLGSLPPSLYWEEAALGYDAYSIWQTGKDYHGNPFPIVAFESFGDYKPSGYFYLLAPVVGLFGLNEWSVRLPSAIAGIISVYLVYLIGFELFRKKGIGLLSAFVLAVLPWHIQFSRAAFEVTVATMWLLVGIVLLLKTKRNPVLLVFSGLAFVASTYTYHGLRVLAPLLAIAMVIHQLPTLRRSVWLWITGILVTICMLPLLLQISRKEVSQRFQETSVFSISSAVTTTNDLRAQHGNTPLSRLIYHRYWYWLGEVSLGMVKHFNPRFLFVYGDGNIRHQISGTGLLYWWMAVPLLVSLIQIKKKSLRIPLLFLCGWIVLASLPPALAYPSPHTLRFLPASPAFALLIGFGIATLLAFISRFRSKRFIFIACICIVLGELFGYIYHTSTRYPVQSSREWQYGYKEAVHFLGTHANETERILFTRAYGRPSIYFLFYSATDPLLAQAESLRAPKDQSELLRFKNIDFVKNQNTQYAWIVNNEPLEDPSYSLVKTIQFLDGTPAFYLYKN